MTDVPEEGKLKIALEAWKTAVDVQQHFNTIEMQIRNIAVTVLTATVAAAAIVHVQTLKSAAEALAEHAAVPDTDLVVLWGFGISAARAILLGGLVAWIAFYLMDRFWYHKLLQGAVSQGLIVERFFRDSGYDDLLALTSTIGKASPVKVGRWELHSSRKLDLFYLLVATLMILAIFVM